MSSFVLLAGSHAAIAAVDPPSEADVDAVFAEWNRDDSPGCAATVVEGGRQVYRKGFGMASLELGVPIGAETVFDIASVSKQFTATAIALLAEDGSISLDDEVRRYVPELPSYGQPIRISHLVHHTSGLRDYMRVIVYSAGSAIATEDQALQFISRQKATNFTPGSAFQYSNSNYLLMAVIVRRVTGLSLREYTDAHIFKPLGMHRTRFYDDTGEIISDRAVAHGRDSAGEGWTAYHTQNLERPAAVGSGLLLTTIDDLARWERNFLDNRLGRGGPGLIRRLTTPDVFESDGSRYGFGLEMANYRGLPAVWHGGAAIYRAHMLRFPGQKLGIFVLCNAVTADPKDISEKVADLYLRDDFVGPKPKPPERGAVVRKVSLSRMTDKQIGQLAGNYFSEEMNTFYTLVPVEEGLEVKVSESVSYPLAVRGTEALGFNPDSMSENGIRMEFSQDGSGKVNGFSLDMFLPAAPEKPFVAKGIGFRKF